MDARGAGAVTWRVGLHVAAMVAIGLVVWRAAGFLALACVALVLAAALESPVSALTRRSWPRGLAIAAVCAAAVAVLLGAASALVPRVVPQLQQAADAAPDVVSDLLASSQYRWLQEHEVIERAWSRAREAAGSVASTILSAAVGVASFAGGVVTVAALTVFLLTSGPAAWGWLLRWVHPSRRPRVRRLGAGARRAVAGYVAGALVMGGIAGAVTAVTTALLGVPYFLALAVVTALFGIVPFIGAIASGVLVVATTFVTSGPTAALIALAVFVAYQQLEGAVLQPLVQRRAVSMSPLVVIAAVLLGTYAGGVLGGVLALPFAAAAKVVLEDVLERRRRSWRRPPGQPAPRAASPAAPH